MGIFRVNAKCQFSEVMHSQSLLQQNFRFRRFIRCSGKFYSHYMGRTFDRFLRSVDSDRIIIVDHTTIRADRSTAAFRIRLLTVESLIAAPHARPHAMSVFASITESLFCNYGICGISESLVKFSMTKSASSHRFIQDV